MEYKRLHHDTKSYFLCEAAHVGDLELTIHEIICRNILEYAIHLLKCERPEPINWSIGAALIDYMCSPMIVGLHIIFVYLRQTEVSHIIENSTYYSPRELKTSQKVMKSILRALSMSATRTDHERTILRNAAKKLRKFQSLSSCILFFSIGFGRRSPARAVPLSRWHVHARSARVHLLTCLLYSVRQWAAIQPRSMEFSYNFRKLVLCGFRNELLTITWSSPSARALYPPAVSNPLDRYPMSESMQPSHVGVSNWIQIWATLVVGISNLEAQKARNEAWAAPTFTPKELSTFLSNTNLLYLSTNDKGLTPEAPYSLRYAHGILHF